jgi:hypothetical protein
VLSFRLSTLSGGYPAGDHVVPLQDLMEHDPVEEAAETEIQQYPGRGWKLLFLRHRRSFLHLSATAGSAPDVYFHVGQC